MAPSMGMCVGMLTSGAGGGGGGASEWAPECNPVTNEPCDTAGGQACDVAGPIGFVCYDPPNDGLLCQECDQDTIYCAGTMTCDTEAGLCVKYCCSNADCGTGTCVPFGIPEAPELGQCAAP